MFGMSIPAKENRRFELALWCSAILCSIVVWVISSISWLIEPIQNHKSLLILLLGQIYLLVFLYTIVWKKKRDAATVLALILLGGGLLRAAYVLAAPYNISSHDMGYFPGLDTTETAWGHLGYIDYIFKNHHAPNFDPGSVWGFSNPPGFYTVGALALGISRLFRVGEPWCYEALQAVSLLFSNLTVLTMYRIFREFSIPKKWLLLLTALISFHPFSLIMAVSVNNDGMMAYFIALAVWYTVRWCKEPTFKNILVIALAIGVAMFTKLNGATVCLGIGVAFICVFWANRKAWKHFIAQFSTFLAVCAPMGLSWPLSNMVKYGMPFLFIQRIGEGNWLYLSDTSILPRLGLPSIAQCFYPFIKFDNTLESNILIQTLRTALFDELHIDSGAEFFKMTALLLLVLSLFLCIVMNLILIWSIFKKGLLRKDLKIFLLTTYAGMIFAYLKFCIDEPAICTMNYRYIPIALLFPCICVGLWAQHLQSKGKLERKPGGKLIEGVLQYSIIGFVGLAVIVNICLILWSFLVP